MKCELLEVPEVNNRSQTTCEEKHDETNDTQEYIVVGIVAVQHKQRDGR